jgi:hypothetical protein
MEFDWWLRDDPVKNQRTLDILRDKNITHGMIQEWHKKNRLEKNLKKNGFKPNEASSFRVLFEQQTNFVEVNQGPSILEMTDAQLALDIVNNGTNVEHITYVLAALRRHAYGQGFAAASKAADK